MGRRAAQVNVFDLTLGVRGQPGRWGWAVTILHVHTKHSSLGYRTVTPTATQEQDPRVQRESLPDASPSTRSSRFFTWGKR